MLDFILKFLTLFTKLPKPVQTQIIDAIIYALTFAFRHLFKNKKKEDLKQATAEAVTPATWEGSRLTMITSLPTSLTQIKKERFAKKVTTLVQSDAFIDELNKRIADFDSEDEEEYVYLCSVETRKLIVEMMDKAK